MSRAQPMGDRRREEAYGRQNGTWQPGRRLVRLTPRQRRRWLHKRNSALPGIRKARRSK